jgi:AcrR family transcriptional regulator
MTRETRRRRPDERPGEIITAALELFSERGFTATRLDDVALRAGLSKAAIYLYFDDKTALLKAVIQATAGASLEQVRLIAAKPKGPVAPLLRQLLLTVAGRMSGTRLPDVIKLVISESRAHPEIGRSYLENVIGQALPLVQSLIEKGIATGEFRAVDPRMTVKCVVAPMVLAAVWRSVFEPIGAEPLDIEALATLHADLIIKGLSSGS